jgi:3-phytase
MMSTINIAAIGIASLSLALAGCAGSVKAAPKSPAVDGRVVAASGETAPAPSTEDAADDPAIWIAPGDGSASLILGTDKQAGLYVYGLDGMERQRLPVGPLNNVDLRQGGAGADDVAVASNDGRDAVSVYAIDRATGAVAPLADFPTGKPAPYGICLGLAEGGYEAFVTYRDGAIQRFTLDLGVAPSMTLEATYKLASQLEGCVVDEEQRLLFIGEEAKGVWSLRLDEKGAAPALVDAVGGASGLAADVEGLSLWRGPGGEGYLVASAQGASRFVVYDRRPPHKPRGAFAVGAGAVDEVTGTDGLDVAARAVGPDFPHGLLVVQDDVNAAPAANQNFKLVDWRAVEAALGLGR